MNFYSKLIRISVIWESMFYTGAAAEYLHFFATKTGKKKFFKT